jgi:RHS repeat-associated protein
VTSAGTKTKYRYDGAGQRIAKKVGSSNAEYYILDGPTTLGVVTLNGSGTPVSWHFNILAGATPVGRHTNTAARFYYHTDMLGSTRTVVTAAGANAEGYTYYPYGLLNEGLSANFGATKEGFTGKERDAETALSYFGARYYMPALGRWGAVDPLADEFAGWSGYNYVMGDPAGVMDPDGRSPFPLCPACIGAAIGGGIAVASAIRSGEDFTSLRTWGKIGASALIGGLSGGLAGSSVRGLGALAGQAGLGAAEGGAVAALDGGDILSSAATGAVIGLGGELLGAGAGAVRRAEATLDAQVRTQALMGNPDLRFGSTPAEFVEVFTNQWDNPAIDLREGFLSGAAVGLTAVIVEEDGHR